VRVVFASARSAPGVTTAMLACASVWPGEVLLVEAAEDGGSLAARFGLPLEPGLMTLGAAARNSGQASLASHTQVLPGTDGRISVLVGPPATEPAQALLKAAAARIAPLLAEIDAPVLIDAGRLSAAPLAAPLIAGADRLLLVARPRVEELQALAHRLPVLARFGPTPELLLVGDTPYGPEEVATTLGCRVLGVLAHDPAAADALAAVAPSRRLARSLLLRSATTVVGNLAQTAVANVGPEPTVPSEPGVRARRFTAVRP
jgi:hypothetical protein